jgi:hypothetical protein
MEYEHEISVIINYALIDFTPLQSDSHSNARMNIQVS